MTSGDTKKKAALDAALAYLGGMENELELLSQTIKLLELCHEAYQQGRNAQVTLHFGDGLIKRIRKEDWENW